NPAGESAEALVPSSSSPRGLRDTLGATPTSDVARMPSLAQRVRKQVLQIDDVMLGESGFEGRVEALFVDSRQMAMILEREVSLRLSWPVIREHRDRLRSDPRVAIPRSGS